MIGVIGLSYKNAELAFREKFAFCTSESASLLSILMKQPAIMSVVVLSTCNRTEIYFHSEDVAEPSVLSKTIVAELYRFVGLDLNLLHTPFFTLLEHDCIRHLFKVASGLDSMVIGETQILGQIKDAYRISVDNNASSGIMSRLFHKSFEVAKKIRANILVAPVLLSAGSEAVNYVMPHAVANPQVLVIGAGQMAETVLIELRNKAVENTIIYNRTEERAAKMAQRFNCKCITGGKLKEAITKSDLVIVATSALNTVVSSCMVNERTINKRIFFDLAVPRNVDERVANIKGNSLFSIDDLKNIDNNSINELIIAQANVFIDEMISEFNAWLKTLNLSPAIEVIAKKFNDVLDQRLSYLENKVSDSELLLLENTGKYLKNKYLNLIVVAMKELSTDSDEAQKISRLNRAVEKLSNT